MTHTWFRMPPMSLLHLRSKAKTAPTTMPMTLRKWNLQIRLVAKAWCISRCMPWNLSLCPRAWAPSPKRYFWLVMYEGKKVTGYISTATTRIITSVRLSTRQLVNLLSRQLLNLSTRQLVNLSARQLVNTSTKQRTC